MMLKATQLRVVALLGVVSALAVGGVAAAQNGGDSQSGNQGGKAQKQGEQRQGGKAQRGHHRGGPMAGPPIKGLTYAEFHVQNKEGKAEVIRLDQGDIKSVGSSSITLVENDDTEVTVAVDSDTKVIGKPGKELALSDLSTGQRVTVSGPKGGTAKAIAIAPKKGEMKGGPRGEGGPPAGERAPDA
jgi:hypothetical protein